MAEMAVKSDFLEAKRKVQVPSTMGETSKLWVEMQRRDTEVQPLSRQAKVSLLHRVPSSWTHQTLAAGEYLELSQ